MAAVYLDSSALVKLVVREPESLALQAYLQHHSARVTCALVRVEVVRAVRGHGRPAIIRARQLLDRLSIIGLDDLLLDDAAALGDDILRSLDAIHLAAARSLASDLTEIVTYDRRMADAAAQLGLAVAAPD